MIKHIIDTTNKIIKGTLPYQTFAKELSANESFNNIKQQAIRTLVNALLNRYYRYLYSLTKNEETNLTTEEVLALSLYSFNVEKHVLKLSYEELLSALPASSQVKLEEKYPETVFPIKIPQGLHSESLALLYATRFSAPYFLIEQLIADIGKKNILKFLSIRPKEASGLINTNIISDEEFFDKHKEFSKGEKPGHFIYNGKDFIKKTKPYVDNEIILTTQSMLEIAELIASVSPKDLLFVQYDDTSLVLLLALLYPEITIHYTAEEPKSRFILQHLVRKFALKNISYVNSIAQTYDMVVTSLSSSNINGNIRHRDFYFRLPVDLNEITEKAKEQLLSVKDYVKDEGNLIFVTSTALRSETHYQALSFIRDHSDFYLEKEKQYFHFNEYHETVYYAFFKKGLNDEQA